jgi:hypothetical protein
MPLPDCPEGVNPFVWILRAAAEVREARREIAERELRDRQHERYEENRPPDQARSR